ncbi:hypothetical protein [Candidatus Sororendozoicomonas aggregata]|uniref:hypothetical protein n=1 Tax=Candidatus Sororendozoicomonas aggregata TaxID=3073239 RepID=UPI002ED04635
MEALVFSVLWNTSASHGYQTIMITGFEPIAWHLSGYSHLPTETDRNRQKPTETDRISGIKMLILASEHYH